MKSTDSRLPFYQQERRRRLDEEKKADKEIDRLKDEIEKLKRRYGVSATFFQPELKKRA